MKQQATTALLAVIAVLLGLNLIVKESAAEGQIAKLGHIWFADAGGTNHATLTNDCWGSRGNSSPRRS